MVVMGAARMTPVALERFEVARAELVEELAGMVNRGIQHGKTEAQSALRLIDATRAIFAKAAGMDDLLADLDAAERSLRLYLST
jgi:hypothetical protein